MRRATALMIAAIVLAACGSPDANASADTTELRVFAASSLTNAFSQLGEDFQQAHAGMRVSFTFGSSTDLAEQITGGADADVFAAASESAMDAVAQDPGVQHRANFASNHLAIVTPIDNPAQVVSLDSLTSPMAIAIGAEATPIGDYTRQMLDAQGIGHAVLTNVVSNEPDDASIVAKVQSGDVDAGIVYASDIPITAATLHAVDIPLDMNVTAVYATGVVAGSAHADAAMAFVDFVLGDHGQVVLDSHGFEPPPE
jgi:molybdate transport system substrate-binding protein